MSIILGIDPGTNLLGYAFLHVGSKKPKVITMGVLDMRKMGEHIEKLEYIFNEIKKLIEINKPTSLAVEAPFFHKDVQAMLKLGRAQGSAMAAGFACGVPVTEYLPKVVKKAVTGNGNASKEQVAGMLPHLVDGVIDEKYKDATDALGVAVCHSFHASAIGGASKKYTGWDAFLKDNPDKKGKI